MDYNQDFGALVDEKGKIEDGKLLVKEKELEIKDFEGQLYSRKKPFG